MKLILTLCSLLIGSTVFSQGYAGKYYLVNENGCFSSGNIVSLNLRADQLFFYGHQPIKPSCYGGGGFGVTGTWAVKFDTLILTGHSDPATPPEIRFYKIETPFTASKTGQSCTLRYIEVCNTGNRRGTVGYSWGTFRR